MLHSNPRIDQFILAVVLASFVMTTHAQSAQTSGSLVVVPATGELSAANDEAHATLNVEEQDKDKAAAASRVNTKMKRGVDIIRLQDPQAQLRTRGYYTYAVYAEEVPRTNKPRPVVGWRVGQYLEVTTTNLERLPKTVAAVQGLLGLNNLQFGLSPATARKLDADLIKATYQNLNERIASIAAAMGRSSTDATVETVDFEGSGNYVPPVPAPKTMMMRAMADAPAQETVAEPSFEAGESTLGMRLVGKIRFR